MARRGVVGRAGQAGAGAGWVKAPAAIVNSALIHPKDTCTEEIVTSGGNRAYAQAVFAECPRLLFSLSLREARSAREEP